jgi:alkyl hydroperoxide reductase subunit D
MSLTDLSGRLPDYARDIRLNLEAVLSEEGAPGLSLPQIWGTALACAYAVDYGDLVEAIVREPSASFIDDAYREAARGAATIMAMNNVYYRGIHLMEDSGLQKLPARLRMNVIGKPGIAKADFEAMCFAVSAIAGCGQCLTSHKAELFKAGIADLGVQSLLRIASVIKAADQALRISRI